MAHYGKKFQCPSCLRFFESMTAMTQHAESPSMKCQLRHTNEFAQYLDLLTAGLADVGGRHLDNTLRYVVPEEAAGQFMEAATSEHRKLLRTDTQKTHEEYRSAKTPKW